MNILYVSVGVILYCLTVDEMYHMLVHLPLSFSVLLALLRISDGKRERGLKFT